MSNLSDEQHLSEERCARVRAIHDEFRGLPGEMAREIERLRGTLEMIRDRVVCPELFGDDWNRMTEIQQEQACALVMATAALEPRHD